MINILIFHHLSNRFFMTLSLRLLSLTSFALLLALFLFSPGFTGPAHAQNILFYGNSFTQGQGSTRSVPALIQSIATAAGRPVPRVVMSASGGADFARHLADSTAVIGNGLPAGQKWNFAVLQNHSTKATHVGNLTEHRANAVNLYQAIASHSPDFTPVLFETWASGPGHWRHTGANPLFPGGPTQQQVEVREGYRLAALDIDAVPGAGTTRIAAVGDRFEDLNWENLQVSDLHHAQNRGTLLASLVIYSTIYEDFETSKINLDGVLNGLNLTHADGVLLTELVDTAAIPEPSSMLLILSGLIFSALQRIR